MKSSITISTPRDFSFWRTVYSHGWCSLPPFSIEKEKKTLSRPFLLSTGSSVLCTLSDSGSKIKVHMESDRRVTPRQRSDLRLQILECFRLGEDFREFYSEARRYRQYQWIPRLRVGRLLRAPTVFEDVVKMLCTTNCSWGLTEAMIGNLVTKLGTPVGPSVLDFPSPNAIADVTESYLRREIRSGYRSPYLLELARNVVRGSIKIESWRTTQVPTEELYEQVISIKGIGAYAAGNILKLLGRYDYLGLDSWVRKRFADLHKNGRKTADASIEKYYKPYGKWKGLFFWLEMTREWHTRDFPF
jgi:3-methyladenine DNA glycosylase/8-oxoguanine DNA glycosylase